ncbi:MAG: hypothetical protein JST42_00745 [Bacteroidetes bacterium]|nr:hypothetical protein [Bacteroidota bacterium]
MLGRVFATTTNNTVNLDNLQVSQSTGTQRMLFEYFFTTADSLKEQNKLFFIFLQYAVNNNGHELVQRILSDDALKDIHPSLIKSALIMTEHVPGLEAATKKAHEILLSKL